MDCLEELYRVLGEALVTDLKKQNIRTAVFREVIGKLDQIAPSGIALPEASVTSSAGGGSTLRSGGGRRSTSASLPEDSATSGVTHADGSVKVDVLGDGGGKGTGSASATAGGKRPSSGPQGGKRYEGGFPGSSASDPSTGACASAPPIPLPSERELALEMEAISSVLSSLVPEWTDRVAAMARLEGIASGNPGMLDAMNELIRSTGMRGSLTKQVGAGCKAVCE